MSATRIAHITDLHFGAEDPAVVAALLDELNADPPDLVAISGDLTQGARIGEFRAARAFMDRLRSPSLAVPGNHDISPYNLIERFSDPYARWRRIISPETAPMWRNERVAVLGLNSARRLGLHWDWSRGRVTHHRLMRLLAQLQALPAEMVKIVVVHHPLLPPLAEPRHASGRGSAHGAAGAGGTPGAAGAGGASASRFCAAGPARRGTAIDPPGCDGDIGPAPWRAQRVQPNHHSR